MTRGGIVGPVVTIHVTIYLTLYETARLFSKQLHHVILPPAIHEGSVFFSWLLTLGQFSSVHFSCSIMSDSLRPHRLQHARPPCPSPTPRIYSDSCPSSQWCHPTTSSSVAPFSSHLQSFPASGSFPMSQLFASGSQSIGVSAWASVLPMNIQDWFL